MKIFILAGVHALLQTAGIGDLRCNTLLLNFREDWHKEGKHVFDSSVDVTNNNADAIEYVDILRDTHSYGYGFVITR